MGYNSDLKNAYNGGINVCSALVSAQMPVCSSQFERGSSSMQHRSHSVGGRSVVNAVHLFAINQALNLQLQGEGGNHVQALLFLVACCPTGVASGATLSPHITTLILSPLRAMSLHAHALSTPPGKPMIF